MEDHSQKEASNKLVSKAKMAAEGLIETAQETAERLIHNETILKLLDQHFRQDDERFNNLSRSMDEVRKSQDRHEELMKINGNQISHFNKNLIEIKENSEKHQQESLPYREKVLKYMKNAEPMLKTWEDNKLANEIWGGRFWKYTKVFLTVAGVIGALAVIKGFLVKFFI